MIIAAFVGPASVIIVTETETTNLVPRRAGTIGTPSMQRMGMELIFGFVAPVLSG
jgi:hypothetical protein